jgi:hypothetical protein
MGKDGGVWGKRLYRVRELLVRLSEQTANRPADQDSEDKGKRDKTAGECVEWEKKKQH